MQNALGSLPFNISLLILKPENLKGLSQIKVLDIFEASSTNFHPDGLFSTEAFGKVGDERRNRLFAYIDLGTEVFHPVLYKELLNLRELYGGIIAGTAYAVFNKATKDFDPSKPGEGKTGFQFFMQHFKDLVFEERQSTTREFKIKLLNQYRNNATIRQLIVMPAGLRDFTVAPSGKSEEDEINSLYRQVLSISNVVNGARSQADLEHLDATRFRLQQAIQNIYNYITSLIIGDSKLIQSWWTSRNIFNSSRNVITATVAKSNKLFDELSLSPNDIVVGLYQFIASVKPITVHYVREYSLRVFGGMNAPARLVNKKTLKTEVVRVSPDAYDSWVTQEGIEKQINHFSVEDRRSYPIVVDDHYFGLIYNDGKVVRFFQDIDDLPEGFEKKHVSPITYAELFYMAVAARSKELYSFTTRYPVINFGGVYPGSIYLKTTTKSSVLTELGADWKKTSKVYNEFPLKDTAFVNSMSPASSHIQSLGADYDGDMQSFIPVMTEESIAEISTLLKSPSYYVNTNNEMNFSSSNNISDLVFAELSA